MRPLLLLLLLLTLKLLVSREYGDSCDVGALSRLEVVARLRPVIKASGVDNGPETVERRRYLSIRRRTDRE